MKKVSIPTSICALLHPGSPIYLVSTISKLGVLNIAPYGMIMSVSYSPLTYAVGSDKDRDTYRNILATKEFVLNLARSSQVEKIDICAERFPPNISEFEKANLTPLPSLKVKPPRIKECPAHIECSLQNIIEINKKEVIIIAKAVSLSLDKKLYLSDFARQKGLLDPAFAIRPNQGYVYYFSLGRYVDRK